MGDIMLACPNLKCTATLQVNDKMRGKKVRCKKCGQVVVVPSKPAPR